LRNLKKLCVIHGEIEVTIIVICVANTFFARQGATLW